MTDKNSRIRQLPKVDQVIRMISADKEIEAPMVLIKSSVQKEIGLARQKILSGEPYQFSMEHLAGRIKAEIKARDRLHLRRVINGTGVILHTNLGRARLSPEVSRNLTEISAGYSNLEYDLDSGERGTRYDHVEDLIKVLTGAEAALVVNNNAASVCLVLDSMVKGKEVIVSRGELVEIGGSFRVPEIMKASGCTLKEVGTTNKTHERDYAEGICENTGALLKVHTSNYKIIGFTEEVSLDQLKNIGEKHGLPVIYDLGSGLLFDLSPYGVGNEPTVKRCLDQKADIVCFSGDKLLGGPQAGIIVGKAEYIGRMKQNPLLRAFRIDKLTLSALELTLRQYLSPEKAIEQIPTLGMIAQTKEALRKKAELFYHMLEKKSALYYEILDTESQIGGGTMPGISLPSYALAIAAENMTAGELECKMRKHSTPVIGRIFREKVLLDVRTMELDEIKEVASFLNHLKLKGEIQ